MTTKQLYIGNKNNLITKTIYVNGDQYNYDKELTLLTLDHDRLITILSRLAIKYPLQINFIEYMELPNHSKIPTYNDKVADLIAIFYKTNKIEDLINLIRLLDRMNLVDNISVTNITFTLFDNILIRLKNDGTVDLDSKSSGLDHLLTVIKEIL